MALMSKEYFIELARAMMDNWSLHEQIKMTEVNGDPLLDADGNQIIQDVLVVGDARLYIERDDNDVSGAQDLIDWLAALPHYLPMILTAPLPGEVSAGEGTEGQ